MSGSSFASLALGLSGAGAVQGVVGNTMQARNQRAQLESQARIAEINAGIAESNARALEDTAQSVMDRAAVEEQATRRKFANLKGSQRAAYGASGVDLGSDTALDVLTSTDILENEDVATIRENAVRSAWGYRMEATNARGAGGQQRMGANSARASAAGISPTMAATTSLLSGATQVADSWYRTQRGVSMRGRD
jgi:hypothetical protein